MLSIKNCLLWPGFCTGAKTWGFFVGYEEMLDNLGEKMGFIMF